MSTQAFADRLSRALETTGLCQPVNATFGENRVAVLCRVKEENKKKWTELLHKILLIADEESEEVHAWQCHFCQNYFLKDQKMVYGWNISIQSREMNISVEMISRALKGLPLRNTNKRELDEFPLHGAPADRNAPKGGRGVHTIGGSNGDFSPGKK